MIDAACAGEATIFVPEISALGGVERLLLSLSAYLHARAQPHRIVCFRRGVDLDAHATTPLNMISLDPPRHPAAEAYALRRLLRRQRNGSGWLAFDLKGAFYAALARMDNFVLHLTDPPSLLPLDVSKHALSVRPVFGEPRTSGDAGVRSRVRGELVHRINRSGVRRARNVVVMTRRISAEIKVLYGREAIVLPPGVDQPKHGWIAAGRRRAGIPRLRILLVSRLETSKRVDWLLRALHGADAPLSAHRWPEWQLDVIGAGPVEASLRQLASTLGLDGRVSFHGAVDDDELERFYRCADLAVIPGIQGYGLPALEALARCIPVVVHADSGVSDLLAGCAWVEVVRGGEKDLLTSLSRMIARIVAGEFDGAPRPEIPTAPHWAESIAALLDASDGGIGAHRSC